MKTTEGIILKIIPYMESSVILKILTKDYGLIGVIAKGAKRPKSPLKASLERFVVLEFDMIYKPDKLSILTAVEISQCIENIKKDIVKIAYLSYIAELVLQVSIENNAPKIYSILKNSIIKLENGLNPAIITNIVELKMLDFLGLGLNLSECTLCGRKNDILTIDSYSGGYVCKYCYKSGYIYDNKTIKMIRLYQIVGIDSIKDFNISLSVQNNINRIIKEVYSSYSGLYLKSKKFLNEVLNDFN